MCSGSWGCKDLNTTEQLNRTELNYHVPSAAGYISAFSFCFYCCVCGALSVGWKFMVPLYCGTCSLWMGLD